jgi:hypothetical protein
MEISPVQGTKYHIDILKTCQSCLSHFHTKRWYGGYIFSDIEGIAGTRGCNAEWYGA